MKKYSQSEGASHSNVTRKDVSFDDAREASLFILKQVIYGTTDAQEALDKVLVLNNLSNVDKKLCTELVYGTIRQKIRLDWFLRPFLHAPEKLPVEIILALEMALYEFFFLRIPSHASFDKGVSLVKKRFGKRMGGLVNAILRNAQRNEHLFVDENFYLEDNYDSGASVCSDAVFNGFTRQCSLPLWIGHLWEKAYGIERAKAYLKASSQNAPAGIRFRSLLKKSKTFSADQRCIFSINDTSFAFENGLPEEVSLAIEETTAVRQSTASYEVLHSLHPEQWAMPIWDCCAGRGGKSMALIDAGYSVELASDVSVRRLSGFQQELGKQGVTNQPCIVSGSVTDISYWLEEKGQKYDFFDEREEKKIHRKITVMSGNEDAICSTFGTVLVDAPCSGLGTLSRHPEIRLRRTISDIKGLATAQYKILRAAAARVRKGGNLVYITCTLTEEENEKQVSLFLKDYPHAKVVTTFTTPYDSPLKEFFFGVCFVLE